MQIFHGIDGLLQCPPGAVMTIGNFDGLHRGHQRILETCRKRREQTPGSKLVVVTFEPHPLTVLRPQAVAPRLTTAAMKQELIEAQGADIYVILPPTPAVLNLTAEAFFHILRDQVRPAFLIEGLAFTFGKDRAGNVRNLAEWAKTTDIRFELTDPLRVALLDLSVVTASSSLVRWLVSNGRVRDAAICLGRPYTLRGTVVKGHQRGRTIGVPTANLHCPDQQIPADGVYAGRCRVGNNPYPAAVSIGDMPTFGTYNRQIEAHLLDFADDLYGRELDLELLDWLREQSKFSSVPALKAQIDLDVAQTRRRSAMDPSEPIGRVELASV